MSWLPRNVGSAEAEECGVVYRSSLAKRFARPWALLPLAKLMAPDWNAKSSTALMSVSRTYGAVSRASASNTSPNMKKSSLPRERAWSWTAVVKVCQNSLFTCLTVSMRKPSMPRSTQVL